MMISGTGTVVYLTSVSLPYSPGGIPGVDGMDGGVGSTVTFGFAFIEEASPPGRYSIASMTAFWGGFLWVG